MNESIARSPPEGRVWAAKQKLRLRLKFARHELLVMPPGKLAGNDRRIAGFVLSILDVHKSRARAIGRAAMLRRAKSPRGTTLRAMCKPKAKFSVKGGLKAGHHDDDTAESALLPRRIC